MYDQELLNKISDSFDLPQQRSQNQLVIINRKTHLPKKHSQALETKGGTAVAHGSCVQGGGRRRSLRGEVERE